IDTAYSPVEYAVSAFPINTVYSYLKDQYDVFSQLNMAYRSSDIAADRIFSECMTGSSTKELVTPYKEPERVFRLSRKLSRTRSLDYLSSLEFNLFFDPEDQFKEEQTETMGAPTIEEYMTTTRDDYGSGIARPKFDDKAHFEFKG
ncbi:hypothetical protein Tco_1005458, partial [Tanacetum coccineum]